VREENAGSPSEPIVDALEDAKAVLGAKLVDSAAKHEPTKEPLFFVRPAPGKVAELADSMADGIIAMINSERAARGLPPMPKELRPFP
jgi:hypothetical protein